MPSVLKYKNGLPQQHSNSIFGKYTDEVLTICRELLNRYLWPHEYGYPSHPALEYIKEQRGKLSMRDASEKWRKEHQEEYQEYRQAVKEWEDSTERLLGILYSIARRKHLHIEWLRFSKSACMPDRFMVYKNGNSIAMIQM